MAQSPIGPALERIAARFAARLPSRLEQLEAHANALSQETYAPEMEALLVALHELAGTAPPLGYKDLGARAREAEIRLLEIKAMSGPPTDQDLAALRSMALALRETVPATGVQ
ncbi:Hpt domain-containing protein [Rhodobium gokarnense]|uniref:HPt (Histidine-containing phosphotransfer) domain-containing protein n=1 Tax=Rhodobium gokarnense TaxID=364296 RepID=A0ABT3HBG3_9HYPH|nr:Hpt domain-containing protein [Rhodobium gokarnense]MCW2307721.1 HPt (histidine-containing phosphotransfer) domain-containing protein [Rhodobium gokarnense]